MSKVTIEIPPGYELVQTGKGMWEQRKIERDHLPKTWEEFCEMDPVKGRERYINDFSDILALTNKSTKREPFRDRNLLPNLETTQAVLALCQLIQLRNFYNGDWVPDWSNGADKWVIAPCCDHVEIYPVTMSSRVLSFKTKEICGQFLENFRDLIEIAKPLI